MAKARAIIRRLKAVQNIRKITRTMELIATARFKKAMDRAVEAAVYTRKISEIVSDLARANLSFSHPLLQPREHVKNTVLFVITSNRGYCGGYNGGILRMAYKRYEQAQKAGENIIWEVAGKRGINFLKFEGLKAQNTYTSFEDKPLFDEIEPIADRFIKAYIAGEIDRVEVVYTEFISSARQYARVVPILPLSSLGGEPTTTANKTAANTTTSTATAVNAAASKTAVDYEFLPSPTSILEEIVPAAFKAKLFKCFLDAAVSEQIARMVAMKGATDNADEMIGNIKQSYNRARQSQITSELAEIIGGAAALE
jgi:F-type H+-transporting ATPase subunit gamma